MIEKIVNVVIKEDGFDNLNSKATTLDDNLENISHSNKSVSSSFAESSNAILENGGAMGLLNDLTGGYAMMVKDAVEASALFIVKKRADTVATNATTAATVSANTATQQGIIGKVKDIATTVSSTVAKYATATATQVVTAAQWLWNAAVLANPLVALVVAIVAAGAAIYKLTTFLIASTKANEEAALATAKMTKELQAQSVAAARGLRALQENADYTYELAKANGASTAELRKMKEAAINAEIALNKKNVTIAQATFLQERNNLAVAKANDLSDEEIAKKEKLVQAAYKEFQEQNNLLDKSYKDRAKLTKDFNIEIANENTIANEKAAEQRKKDNEDFKKQQAEKTKLLEEAFKARQETYKKEGEEFFKSLEDAKVAAETLAGEQRAALDEILISQSDVLRDKIQQNKENEKLDFKERLYLNKLYLDTALNDATISQKEKDRIIKESNDAEKELNSLKSKAIIGDSLQTLNSIAQLAGEGTTIAKGVAVAQATMSGIEGVQNAYTTAQKSPITAFFPAYPIVQAGLAGVFSALQIKKILSVDKSGKGGGGSVGGSSPAPPPPQFNIVGQSGTNQLAQSIGARQGQPIQAYVVGNEVTSQQALDRNRVSTATFN